MQSISKTAAWQALAEHYQQISKLTIKDQFDADASRAEKFSLTKVGIFFDYSKNLVDENTRALLLQLTETAQLKTHIADMFSGKKINITEQRAVLHTALRNPKQRLFPEVHTILEKIYHFADLVRDGMWHGFSGKPITNVVNIGIGGSDLGPAMAVKALTPYVINHINFYFVSNVDATHISETLKKLNPETTLFVVASKTFTTQETLCNALTAKEWLLNQAQKSTQAINRHFVAVTANSERAVEFGISAENVYPFWDWVGGRFSLWSAIGLTIAIAIGKKHFQELLFGAHNMDEHFQTEPFISNLPVLLALIGIWNINFCSTNIQAVIPYDQYLEFFPDFLQQLEMESNGKRVRLDGTPVDYNTAPVILGAVGTNSQHSFHQLLMQGTHKIPVDFIVTLESHNPIANHHLLLYANCLAQSQALMCGKSFAQIMAELLASGMSKELAEKLLPHKIIPGNVPSNTILLTKLTPETLGALIALYEHKVFTQGVIWQINSFDQWGVELGKKLASQIVPKLQHSEKDKSHLDSSTGQLIKKYIARD